MKAVQDDTQREAVFRFLEQADTEADLDDVQEFVNSINGDDEKGEGRSGALSVLCVRCTDRSHRVDTAKARIDASPVILCYQLACSSDTSNRPRHKSLLFYNRCVTHFDSIPRVTMCVVDEEVDEEGNKVKFKRPKKRGAMLVSVEGLEEFLEVRRCAVVSKHARLLVS